MSALTALARLEALAAGRARRTTTVLHAHLHPRPLVLVPLALAGEAAAPLAALVGVDAEKPRLLVVPQPRSRDLRFGFAADLGAELLGYLESFQTGTETVGKEEHQRYLDAPQVVVPNRAGISFLRLLGRSTRFRTIDGDYPVPPAVPLLGRWLTFLADRAQFPGSSALVAATDLLAAHFATGQSALEDASLAALLGWIDPPAGLTGPEAALRAEDPTRCPPAGPATDPGFDNELLTPAIAAFDAGEDGAVAELERLLATQLEPTWRQIWRSLDLLRALPVAAHVPDRWAGDRSAFTMYSEALAEDAPPQPRRDGAVGAAARLDRLERARATFDAQRAFDDPLVMAEYRLTGEAFAGTVVAVDPDRLDGRRLRPLVTLVVAEPLRVPVGATVTSPTRPGQKAVILSACEREVELELTSGMGRGRTPAAGTVPEVDERLTYTTLSLAFQPSAALPAVEDTPWTHGGAPTA